MSSSNRDAPKQKQQLTLFGGIINNDSGPKKKKQKRYRRTNAEIARDRRSEESKVANLAQRFGTFVQETTDKIIATAVSKFHIPWVRIQERDANYQEPVSIIVDNDEGSIQYQDDDDDDDDIDDDDNEQYIWEQEQIDERDSSVMSKYLKGIQSQLREETNTKKEQDEVDRWLLDYLMENQFWIRKAASSYVCQRLGMYHDIEGYYKDVHVWLPDIQFKEMPPCPKCKSCGSVGPHGYQEKTRARKIIGIITNYYIMSRRYICHGCGDKTFTAYDALSIERLPRCISLHFPAFLTHRFGMDKGIIDLMRPTLDSGMKMNAFRNMIAELHEKEHMRVAMLHEWESVGTLQLKGPAKLEELFSTFHDRDKYGGYVPGAKWFRSVYKKYHRSIREHMDNDVKKLDLSMMFVDVSYKAAKKVRNVNRQPIVNGLVTIMNPCNEIRSQFFVPTDAHDQYEAPLKSMMETFKQYGQEGPEYAYTDNPSRDAFYLMQSLPSLRATQDKLDAQFNSTEDSTDSSENPAVSDSTRSDSSENPAVSDNNSTTSDSNNQAPPYDFNQWFLNHCTYLEKKDAINTSAGALLARLEDSQDDLNTSQSHVLGLDTEWFVPTNARGIPCGAPDKLAVIQIAIRMEGNIEVYIYQVHKLGKLPHNLISLLQCPSIKFAGCQIGGDLRKIMRDFDVHIDKESKALEVATMACARGIVTNGRGLDAVSNAILGEPVDKRLQLSDWRRYPLSQQQQKYAAKDAKNSLEIYEHLEPLPDMTVPPPLDTITAGLEVDISPYSGKTFNLGCCAATGIIAEDQIWDNPKRLKINGNILNGTRPGWYIVEVRRVHAPSVKVKGLKETGSRKYVSLGDLGAESFTIPIPFGMLRTHVSDRRHLLETKQQQQIRAREVVTRAQTNLQANSISMSLFQDDDDEKDNDSSLLENNDSSNDVNSDNASRHETDPDASIQNPIQIAQIEMCAQEALKLIRTNGKEWVSNRGSSLSEPPERIIDKFSAILGSGFHACHRIVPPMHHSYKKAFFVALSEAIYAWDEEDMRTLVDLLKDKLGLGEDEIKSWRYFKRRYFARRVKRICLPPSRLYWRVRAVFEMFGPKTDPETGKALFNKRTWTCAKGVMKEILQGYYSDPPGLSLYQHELNESGGIKYDKELGIPLLACKRDTNNVENSHKNLTQTFGSHRMGIEFADCLLAERRHRVNARASRKYRSGFPNTSSYDTWCIDALQNIVLRKHNILLYPNHVNSSDFAPTDETFGFVGLASDELKENINALPIPDDISLPSDLAFLSKSTGLKVAPIPWNTPQELKLFPKLLHQAQKKHGTKETAIVNELSLSILRHVDGKTVFPKLPVYNRLYLKRFNMGRRVKSCAKDMKNESATLHALNKITTSTATHANKNDAETSFDIGAVSDDHHPNIQNEHNSSELENTIRKSFGPMNKTPSVQMPPAIPVMHPANFEPIYAPTFAAGFALNNYSTLEFADEYIEIKRGRDKNRRKKRTCKIFCGLSFCQGANSGKARGGRIRRCQFLPISLLNDLSERRDSEESTEEVWEDGDDVHVINDHISRGKEKRIYKVAIFLQKLSYHSQISYCDSDFWKKDFLK